MGPSGFTEEQQGNRMLEGEVPDTGAAAFLDDIDDVERDTLIRRSMEAVSLYIRQLEMLHRYDGANDALKVVWTLGPLH